MDATGTILFLGIDPGSSINPGLSADALLRQDSLDPDHLDSFAEAWAEISPTRAEQIRHFRDQYIGSARPEDRISARAYLATLVRQTHPATWMRVRERALAILRSRPAPTAPVASPPPVTSSVATKTPPPTPKKIPTLTDILAKESQVPPKFDPFNTTTRDLARLSTPADKLRIQVWIYRKIEAFALSVIKTVEGLEENDFGSLREIILQIQLWRYNILPLAETPLKHIHAGAVDLIHLLSTPLELLAERSIPWQEGLARLRNNFTLHKVTVAGIHGYHTNRVREKYTSAMEHWLIRNSESHRWHDGKWELTATRKGKGFGKMWPPDPNNLRFLTYLDLLGWTVEVKPAGENVIITVDFGNWTAP